MLRLAATAVALVFGMAAAAQTGDDFVPVTDKMLQDPDPADWLSWRRTLERLGLQPARRRSTSATSRSCKAGVDARAIGDRQPQEATPLVYRRRDVRAEPRRLHPGVRREDRRAALGVSSGNSPKDPAAATNRNLAIWGTTLIDAGGDNQIYAIDARTGKLVWETPVHDTNGASPRHVGPDHRRRQGHHGPAMPARRDVTKAASSRRTTRPPARSCGARARFRSPGEPGNETLGRCADGAALARRHVDGAELRSRC